jgi:xanthine dehydrogenase large subunit
MLHIDNCYHLPHLHVVSHRCRTNTQSSTAFRGFGGPQGMFAVETVIDAIARHLGKDPLDVRRLNLYSAPVPGGDPGTMTTHYGQVIEDFVADRIIDDLETSADYRQPPRRGRRPSTPAASGASAAWR